MSMAILQYYYDAADDAEEKNNCRTEDMSIFNYRNIMPRCYDRYPATIPQLRVFGACHFPSEHFKLYGLG